MTERSSPSPNQRNYRRDRWIFLAMAALGILLILFFGLRAARSLRRVRDVRPPEQPIRVEDIQGWMPLGYLSRAFRIPPEELAQGMGIPPDTHPRTSLDQIADRHFAGDRDAALGAAREAIRVYQAAHPPPPP